MSDKDTFHIHVEKDKGITNDIILGSDRTLFDLHKAIIGAYGISDDHLHAFFMDGEAWGQGERYYSPAEEDHPPFSDEVQLCDLGLTKGKQFLYLFDFGWEQHFSCTVM